MLSKRRGLLWVVLGLVTILALAACQSPPGQGSTARTAPPAPKKAESAPAAAPMPRVPDEFAQQVSWVQSFDKPLDTTVFQPETGGDGWGNKQVQYYTNSAANTFTRDGQLVIRAKREDRGGQHYTSARLTTQGSFAPQYGMIVWQGVTLPEGVGTWSALWLYPANPKYTPADMGKAGGSPDTTNGEIDVLEHIGLYPTEVNSSAHTFDNYPSHNEQSGQTLIGDATQAPHNYWLAWTPRYLAFGVDNHPPYYQVKKQPGDGPANWPYDQRYFLITNVAMGGDWGGAGKDQYPPDGIDSSRSQWELKVDAIRYYPLKT